MSDQVKREQVASIKTFEDLQARKAELNREIDLLGKKITADAKSILVSGAKVAAAGVAAVLVTKLITTIAKARQKTDEIITTVDEATAALDAESSPDASTEGPDAPNDARDKVTTILMWIRMIANAIDTARVLLNEVSDVIRANSDEEE